jgi:transcription antitermination factor NusG
LNLPAEGTRVVAVPDTAVSAGSPELLPGRDLRGTDGWHILHVKSRQEKVLAADLTVRGIRNYLPLLRKVRYHGRRKTFVDAPLFPGYLFLWGSLDEAYEADRTRRVANLIRVVDQESLEWELTNIHYALSSEAPLDPYPALRAGVRVEVRGGPFKGLQGVVESRVRMDRLILQVEMLGSAASLEIDGALLELID